MSNFGNSKFLPVFLGKIVGKNLELPFLAILNLFPSFWEKIFTRNLGKIVGKNSNGQFLSYLVLKDWKKFGMAKVWHSEFF